MNNRIVEVTIQAETKMRIGVPADRPTEAIEALMRRLPEMKNVICARLGLMEVLSDDGNSHFHYTIGISCDADENRATQEILDLLKRVPEARWPIAVVPLTSQWFTEESIEFFRRPSAHKKWISRLFSARQ